MNDHMIEIKINYLLGNIWILIHMKYGSYCITSVTGIYLLNNQSESNYLYTRRYKFLLNIIIINVDRRVSVINGY